MATKKKLPTIVVGSLVAFNELPDAVWFEVVAINGFHLTVREYHEKHIYQNQFMDKSLVKQVKPAKGDPRGKPANLPGLSKALNSLFTK